MEDLQVRTARIRIQMEYIEMPDMKLTSRQMRRLLDLPGEACDAALEALVGSGFLVCSREGQFFRTSRVRGTATHAALALAPAV